MMFLSVWQNVYVLDIEGTTTPISFVTEVLFPYAKANVGSFLRSTYNSTETQNDMKLLRDQVSGHTSKILLIKVLRLRSYCEADVDS